MSAVLTAYYKIKPGGLCHRLLRAIRALLARGHTVHYIALSPFPIEHPHCHFHKFPWPFKDSDSPVFWVFFYCAAPWWLLAIAVKYRITHAFAFSPTYGFCLAPLRLLNIRLTVFFRADALKNHELKGRSPAVIAVEKVVEGIAIWRNRAVGVSESLTAAIVGRHRYLRPAQSTTLPNDLDPTSLLSKSIWGHPLGLAIVGVLEHRKNQAMAIRCMREISPTFAVLHLFGDGPSLKELTALVHNLNLSDRVYFHGWQPRETLWATVDVLLAPSLHEGASNAVLEALARGIPVIAVDTPEARELLPQSALLPNDSSVWTDRLRGLSPSVLSELQQQQLKGRSRFVFDWDTRICRDILEDGLSP